MDRSYDEFVLYAVAAAVFLAVVTIGSFIVIGHYDRQRMAEKLEKIRQEEIQHFVTLPHRLEEAAREARHAAHSISGSERHLKAIDRLERDARAAIASHNSVWALSSIDSIEKIKTELQDHARGLLMLAEANELIWQGQNAAKDASAIEAINVAAAELTSSANALAAKRFDAAKVRFRKLIKEIETPLVFMVVDRPGMMPGVWQFRKDDTHPLYYLVVETLDLDLRPFNLPVKNVETGDIDEVSMFAVQVPKDVFDRFESDRVDDGIIDQRQIGQKPAGSLAITWSITTHGETITDW